MLGSDFIALMIVEGALELLGIVAFCKDGGIRGAEKTGAVNAEITRGEKSMTALYTVYSAATASFLVLIINAVGAEGHRVLLVVVAFGCLTYLFFFSTWFRNRIFFPLKGRIRKD